MIGFRVTEVLPDGVSGSGSILVVFHEEARDAPALRVEDAVPGRRVVHVRFDHHLVICFPCFIVIDLFVSLISICFPCFQFSSSLLFSYLFPLLFYIFCCERSQECTTVSVKGVWGWGIGVEDAVPGRRVVHVRFDHHLHERL